MNTNSAAFILDFELLLASTGEAAQLGLAARFGIELCSGLSGKPACG